MKTYVDAKKDMRVLQKEVEWEAFRPVLLAKLIDAYEVTAAIMKIASHLRTRVKCVFDWQKHHYNLPTIGLKRARREIGLQNLTYNLMCFG